ncbi:MAG: hypothetical protein FJY67_00815 [Calditrichaeota bacterium]|nr:hypothetical protein [Calditrichota bacterium]
MLSSDFKEFLKLLTSHKVRYLLIGGFAVGVHGYPRATGDMDLWVAIDPDNADRIVLAIREFGFDLPDLNRESFVQKNKVIRMGLPPQRIELLTSISGVDFDDCFAKREMVEIDGIKVSLIDRASLIANKRAAGRHRDLDDLEHLT